jgi:hypothetical protein
MRLDFSVFLFDKKMYFFVHIRPLDEWSKLNVKFYFFAFIAGWEVIVGIIGNEKEKAEIEQIE